ncbi:hypothetical protein AVEN_108956-1 [Araneus ventricosus]|uniref:Uncharacterized protein n=1 Tax=Araneus ventricosus TaxID=182803 RepID=A0A4Y2F5Y1_ARAVE|nr:hypothetical protein AVEN_108956-1 [Araneus ventricosus]
MNQESFQLAHLTSTPSFGRQRSSWTSPVQPSHCISNLQWPSHCQRSLNSRTFSESPKHYKRRHQNYYQSDNSKCKAHMSIEIAAELIKLVETLESRFQSQQDSQTIIPPPAPNDTADIGADTKVDTTTI